ncbi:MAG TPA: enoyl-CoA hydratase/isomerase family protein [Candidatus Binataceae bacterium]|nr:enoyl-CoA hydratase/isomerase family protein [Candidatus Binataceae bacterium]
MAEQVLKVTRQANYAILTLNRPEKRNALNQPLLEALNNALAEFENDKQIRALLLRGEGTSFCAGIDLREVDEAAGGHNPASLEHVFGRLERFPVPTIAAVQGAALAGGLELALYCDLRVAAVNAKLGMTLGRVGLMVPYDFTRKLIEICGSANTAWILYTAELIDAERGRHMAMVHEVVPDAKLTEVTTALAEKIADNAPLALRAMKATVRRCMTDTFDAWHDDLLRMAREVRESKDAKEGVRAFLEKRKPAWKAE